MQARKISEPQARELGFSLHIRHPSMDPAEISRVLRVEADEAFKAGEPRRAVRGDAPSEVYGETQWSAILDPSWWHNAVWPRPGEVDAEDTSDTATSTVLLEVPAPGADRRERVRTLIAYGRRKGYLTDSEVRGHLDMDAQAMQDIVAVLSELGIPVYNEDVSLVIATSPLSQLDTAQRQVLREHFNVDSPGVFNAEGRAPNDLGNALRWMSFYLTVRHARFCQQVISGGGAIALYALLMNPRIIHNFTFPLAVSQALGRLGIDLRFKLID